MAGISRFVMVKEIGRGSYGSVHLVKRKTDNQTFVLKQLSLQGLSGRERKEAMNEVTVLASLKHPHVVAYEESFTERNTLNIVMEYAEGGDLHRRLARQKGRLLSEEQIVDWFVQLVAALKYVHNQRILHRDLKSQNIFLDRRNNVKLGDFGISKMLESTLDMAKTMIGTPYYMSPELCQNKPYDFKSDVWALGCVLYEMTTLKHAFDAKNINGLVLKILKGVYPPPAPTYSDDLRTLIGMMLARVPDHRPSLNVIVEMPFLVSHVKALNDRFPVDASPPSGGAVVPFFAAAARRGIVAKPTTPSSARMAPVKRVARRARPSVDHARKEAELRKAEEEHKSIEEALLKLRGEKERRARERTRQPVRPVNAQRVRSVSPPKQGSPHGRVDRPRNRNPMTRVEEDIVRDSPRSRGSAVGRTPPRGSPAAAREAARQRQRERELEREEMEKERQDRKRVLEPELPKRLSGLRIDTTKLDAVNREVERKKSEQAEKVERLKHEEERQRLAEQLKAMKDEEMRRCIKEEQERLRYDSPRLVDIRQERARLHEESEHYARMIEEERKKLGGYSAAAGVAAFRPREVADLHQQALELVKQKREEIGHEIDALRPQHPRGRAPSEGYEPPVIRDVDIPTQHLSLVDSNPPTSPVSPSDASASRQRWRMHRQLSNSSLRASQRRSQSLSPPPTQKNDECNDSGQDGGQEDDEQDELDRQEVEFQCRMERTAERLRVLHEDLEGEKEEEEGEEDDEEGEEEEGEEEEEPDMVRPLFAGGLADRITAIRGYCEKHLGTALLEEAYTFLRRRVPGMDDDEEAEREMIRILGDDRLNFWPLIDTLIFCEDSLVT